MNRQGEWSIRDYSIDHGLQLIMYYLERLPHQGDSRYSMSAIRGLCHLASHSGHLGELVPSWRVDGPELNSKSNHNPKRWYMKGGVKEMILHILRKQRNFMEEWLYITNNYKDGVNSNLLIFREYSTNWTLFSLIAVESSSQCCWQLWSNNVTGLWCFISKVLGGILLF